MRSVSRWVASVLLSLGCVASVHAAPCISQTLSDYVSLGAAGCEIGALRFTDFSVPDVLGPATALDAATVNLAPVSGSLGTGFALGFLPDPLSTRTSAGPGEFFSIRLNFNVGGVSPTGAYGALVDPTVSGDGVVTLLEDFCLGASFSDPTNLVCSTPAPQTLIALATELLSDPAVSLDLDPVGSLGVVADLGIDGGLTGSASLVGAELRFVTVAAVAVPSTVLLLLIGGLAAALLPRALRPQAEPDLA